MCRSPTWSGPDESPAPERDLVPGDALYRPYDAGDSRAISDETTGTSGAGNSTPPGEAEGPTPGAGSPRESPRTSPRTPPTTRVPPVNRSQANALVDAALKSGRIIQADHDMRIAQIKGTANEQDIDMIVRDLQSPAQMAAAAVRDADGDRGRARHWPAAVAAGQLRARAGQRGRSGPHAGRQVQRQVDRRASSAWSS